MCPYSLIPEVYPSLYIDSFYITVYENTFRKKTNGRKIERRVFPSALRSENVSMKEATSEVGFERMARI